MMPRYHCVSMAATQPVCTHSAVEDKQQDLTPKVPIRHTGIPRAPKQKPSINATMTWDMQHQGGRAGCQNPNSPAGLTGAAGRVRYQTAVLHTALLAKHSPRLNQTRPPGPNYLTRRSAGQKPPTAHPPATSRRRWPVTKPPWVGGQGRAGQGNVGQDGGWGEAEALPISSGGLEGLPPIGLEPMTSPQPELG